MEQVKSLVSGKRLVYVTPDANIDEVAKIMADSKVGAVVVLEDSKLCGIFTERDLLCKVVAKSKVPTETKVKDVMTSKVVIGRADESYEACLKRMVKVGCRHLPIVEGDRLIGVLSIRDLLMHDISAKDAEIKMMTSLYHYQPPPMEH